jgi:ABC-2 type transport system ATP-binding protein
LIAEGTSHELKSSIGGNALRFQLADPALRAQAHELVGRVVRDAVLPSTDPGSVSVKVSNAAVAAEVLNALNEARIALTDFSLGAPSLDDVFFALTGHAAENGATPRMETGS